MNDRINTFMKDCVWFRALLYFFIAAIPPLIAELGKFNSYSDISAITATIIAVNCLFQGVIAVRAFIDQSISRTKEEKRSSKKVELINEGTN